MYWSICGKSRNKLYLPATEQSYSQKRNLNVMKRILFTCFLLTAIITGFSQHISIASERLNELYIGVDNPLSIIAENYPCSSIIVKTDNGKISGKSCHYTYRGGTGGRAGIILYIKQKGRLKEIGRLPFRVKYIPDPIPRVGPSAGGNMRKDILCAQQYIRGGIETMDLDAVYPIDSFKVCITRGDTCLYNEIQNAGGAFNDAVSNALCNTKEGDTVIFKNIWARAPDGRKRLLNPILFYITDQK
jgi:GldM C-terminal domain